MEVSIFQLILIKIRRILILCMRTTNPDPLNKGEWANSQLPNVDVVIPVAQKDIVLLKRVISGLNENCRNPVKNIHIITPDPNQIDFQLDDKTKIYSDFQYLKIDLKSKLSHIPEVVGWVTQQMIKIQSVKYSKEKYILWLDADTILNSPRSFATSQVIVDLVSDEFHPPYFRGLKACFGFKFPPFRLSRITHHTIIETNAWRKFMNDNQISSTLDWLNIFLKLLSVNMSSSTKDKKSTKSWFIFGKYSFSEYELNGLIMKKYGIKRKKVYWWNDSRQLYKFDPTWIKNNEGKINAISKKLYPDRPYSISYHSWNQF